MDMLDSNVLAVCTHNVLIKGKEPMIEVCALKLHANHKVYLFKEEPEAPHLPFADDLKKLKCVHESMPNHMLEALDPCYVLEYRDVG